MSQGSSAGQRPRPDTSQVLVMSDTATQVCCERSCTRVPGVSQQAWCTGWSCSWTAARQPSQHFPGAPSPGWAASQVWVAWALGEDRQNRGQGQWGVGSTGATALALPQDSVSFFLQERGQQVCHGLRQPVRGQIGHPKDALSGGGVGVWSCPFLSHQGRAWNPDIASGGGRRALGAASRGHGCVGGSRYHLDGAGGPREVRARSGLLHCSPKPTPLPLW